MPTPRRTAALLAMLLAPLSASADQLVSGDVVQIYYDSNGYWVDSDAGAGLQGNHDGTWYDYDYPGTPYQMWVVEFDDDGTAARYYTSSYYGNTMTVVSESDSSTATQAIAAYEYTAANLSITKTDTWNRDEGSVLVHYLITNDGDGVVDNLRLMFALDPDQDYAYTTSTYSTLNDVLDADGDGTKDWVESVGPYSDHTIGYGACDQDNSDYGHFGGSWYAVRDADQGLTDYAGSSGDVSMAIRYNEIRTLEPGATIETSFWVVIADDELTAMGDYLDHADQCQTCDTDGDGFDNATCAGDDCDDNDAKTNPDARETWYDGIDSNCDGANDFDADADGFDSADHDGEDCDDNDATVNPDAVDIWYDGVDSDCDGASDYDADRDGFDSADHGGDDCDDADAGISPGVEETWYDGIDGDCDGGDDFDADRDGHQTSDYGGDDCDDTEASAYPGGEETWYDGIDGDCDGANDFDADADGHESATYGGDDCDDADSATYPGAPDEPYDGVNTDCNEANEYDGDGDGFDSVDYGGDDCDDANSDAYPGSGDYTDDCAPIGADPRFAGGSGTCGCAAGPQTDRSAPVGWLGLALGLGAALLRRRED